MWDVLAVFGVFTLALIIFGAGFVVGVVVANSVEKPEEY